MKWALGSGLLTAGCALNRSTFPACFFPLSECKMFFSSLGIAGKRIKVMMKKWCLQHGLKLYIISYLGVQQSHIQNGKCKYTEKKKLGKLVSWGCSGKRQGQKSLTGRQKCEGISDIPWSTVRQQGKGTEGTKPGCLLYITSRMGPHSELSPKSHRVLLQRKLVHSLREKNLYCLLAAMQCGQLRT